MSDDKTDRKEKIDELLLKLPGVSARKINGLDAYMVSDKMFACLSDDAVGLRLPAAMATELQFSSDYIGPYSPGGMATTREWVQVKRADAADYVKDLDLFQAAVEYVKKGPALMRELVAKLEGLLRLRSIPFGMKLFATVEEMAAIPKIRRPNSTQHTLDQIVAQAARLGWTVGITTEDLVGDQCRSVVGLGGQDEKWYSGQHMTKVWFATQQDAAAHQKAMHVVPAGKYKALAVAPLASGRLDPPDIALFYATPGAMIYFINGLQWSGYKRFDWSVVGESACADSWGRALATREPSLAIPCFAERRYGGVLDDEMLMALPPEQLAKAIEGMEALAKNGFRYPFAQYGIQQDVRAGMAVSYPDRK